MLFWSILISITIVVIVSLVTLLSKGLALPNDNNHKASDVDVYKIHLIEINQEEAAGKISKENANEARLEVARRILASEQYFDAKIFNHDHFIKPLLFIGILLVVAGSWALYFSFGAPNLPEQRFEYLMVKDDTTLTIAEKIIKFETLLARQANDDQLLDQLGNLYLEVGRFRDAANVFNRSLGINGKTASRFLGYAVALVGLDSGFVSKEAENAFRQSANLEPNNPEPQIFLARGLIQNGQPQQAITLLEKFMNDYGNGQIWLKDMQQVVAYLQRTMPQEKIKLSQEQRDLIANNVDKLDAQLQKNSQDVEGWSMLAYAYFLLGQSDKLQATYEKALQVLSLENQAKFIDMLRQKGVLSFDMQEAQ